MSYDDSHSTSVTRPTNHRYTTRAHVALSRLRLFNRHRRHLPPVTACDGRQGDNSTRQSMRAALESCCGRGRQQPSATRRNTCHRARTPAPLVGAPAQRCSAHSPPQRRRQRRRGTRVPLNGLMLAEGGGLTRESARTVHTVTFFRDCSSKVQKMLV